MEIAIAWLIDITYIPNLPSTNLNNNKPIPN
jgi:hypothetical protein